MRCLVPVAALLITGCAQETEEADDSPLTYRVERRDIVQLCSEDGVLEAHRVYSFYPDVGGNRLVALHVKEGDSVRKGATLFEFDRHRIEADRRILLAKIEAARAKSALYRERRSGVETVQARQRLVSKRQEHTGAARALDIQKEMAALGLSPESERESAESGVQAGELGMELARLQLAELEEHAKSPEISDLEVQILDHENALLQLGEKEKHFTGVAPFDGRVIRINDTIRNLGELSAGIDLLFRSGRGPLMIVADTSIMRIITRFFERDVARIKVGQKTLVSSKHVPGEMFEGEVTSIGELGDTLGETTTVAVEVSVDNRKHLLKPGLKAETRIIVGEATGVPAVPVEFLRRSADRIFVWRRTGRGKPRAVTVDTGISDDRYTEIRAGLAEGDVLVME